MGVQVWSRGNLAGEGPVWCSLRVFPTATVAALEKWGQCSPACRSPAGCLLLLWCDLQPLSSLLGPYTGRAGCRQLERHTPGPGRAPARPPRPQGATSVGRRGTGEQHAGWQRRAHREAAVAAAPPDRRPSHPCLCPPTAGPATARCPRASGSPGKLPLAAGRRSRGAPPAPEHRAVRVLPAARTSCSSAPPLPLLAAGSRTLPCSPWMPCHDLPPDMLTPAPLTCPAPALFPHLVPAARSRTRERPSRPPQPLPKRSASAPSSPWSCWRAPRACQTCWSTFRAPSAARWALRCAPALAMRPWACPQQRQQQQRRPAGSSMLQPAQARFAIAATS